MRTYTFRDMMLNLVVGWGATGRAVAKCWWQYNHTYFGGRLRPLPIFLVPTTPYGKRRGWTCCSEALTHIALAAPRHGGVLVTDRGTLLHEMLHQFLFQRREFPSHKGEPWRQGIMRLHQQITGQDIWAGDETVGRVRTEDGGRRSKRIRQPHPETGAASLTQGQIARWPHSVGIDLGPLLELST